jgi:hypothetical protein
MVSILKDTLPQLKKVLGDNLLTQQSDRRIHVSHSLPLVAGESVIQEGNIFWSRRYNNN